MTKIIRLKQKSISPFPQQNYFMAVIKKCTGGHGKEEIKLFINFITHNIRQKQRLSSSFDDRKLTG